VQEIVGEIFLDQIALIAAADNKVIDLVLGVDLKDVPENRPTPDFDHWFWSKDGLLTQPRAKSACKDNCFHFFPLLPITQQSRFSQNITWYVGDFP